MWNDILQACDYLVDLNFQKLYGIDVGSDLGNALQYLRKSCNQNEYLHTNPFALDIEHDLYSKYAFIILYILRSWSLQLWKI